MKDDTSLARRLLIAVATPVVLLFVVGIALTWQIVRMSETSHWVEHSDEILQRTNRLYREIVDQETGLRGYLLTGEKMFLEPYARSRPRETLDELSKLVRDSPEQTARVKELRASYEAWLTLGVSVADGTIGLEQGRSVGELAARKRRMDEIRSSLGEFIRIEEAVRDTRVADSERSTRTTLWTGGVLFFVMAGALAFVSRRQLGSVAATYNTIIEAEQKTRQELEAEGWRRARQMGLAERIRGDKTVDEIARSAMDALIKDTGAVVGAFYVRENGVYTLRGKHALAAGVPERFDEAVGLIGQVGREREKAHLANAPADLLRVQSGVADHETSELLIAPIHTDKETQAVIELGFFKKPKARVIELVERVNELIAIALRSAKYRARLKELLEESQQQAEELQAQQEELRVANEELQQQGEALRGAHAQLEERKEELETSNAGLEAQRSALERAQRELGDKAADLARASQYKSEFLANMSHELRTPLNSTLILAKLLADNAGANLNEEQVRFAQTIHSAANDLLALINDILDLARIEAGRVDVHPMRTNVARLVEPVVRTFEPIAKDKGVVFDVRVDQGAVELETDIQRAQQIARNLLSNAFKFTERGMVTLSARLGSDGFELRVSDTGIGIAREQQGVIFEAFRQADGTTNRKYGGTGLGLSISRDLARLLGGELRVESELGKGSTFILTLPKTIPSMTKVLAPPPLPAPIAIPRAPSVPPSEKRLNGSDDRDALDPRRRILLAVEDDPAFAEILASLARQLDFQFLHATTSDDAIRLALQYVPSAIVLDIGLPDHTGLSVLDRLKREPLTRHVPVHVVSGHNHVQMARSMGAAGYLKKPVSRDELLGMLRQLGDRFARMRRLLVVEDDAVQRDAIRRLLEADEIEIVAVASVAEALEQLGSSTFDCVVTDLQLPDASGYDLLERMASDERYSFPPVIVYTGRTLSAEEEQRLRRYSSSIIVKGARSPERLLDEVTLFLHQVEATLPADRQRMLRQVRDREAVFAGRKILVAEDDVRNVFALTSVLEPKGAQVLIARNGREAVELASTRRDVDLVLMDIMMPEMDGIEAMKEMRRRGGHLAKLPIIALTAKAMKDDQERCLAAGANDYIAKPLDVEMLLSLIRVWMQS